MTREREQFKSTRPIDLDEDKSSKVLVMGIGNYLMGDEGVGVHIVHQMDQMDLQHQVRSCY